MGLLGIYLRYVVTPYRLFIVESPCPYFPLGYVTNCPKSVNTTDPDPVT
jgi:hypothetical protein